MLIIWKKIGETPLEALNRLREKKPQLKDEVLSYAGRLDPMAEGLLMVIIGNENKNRDKYLLHNKEYEVQVLLGVTTDTYDILGEITSELSNIQEITKEKIKATLEKFVGEIEQAYPPYSSKAIDGKSLFEWAREGRLSEIKIPTRSSVVSSIKILDYHSIDTENLKINILEKIDKVNGDFRQEKIKTHWEKFFNERTQGLFQVLKIRVACGSGTYMRTLAHDIGKELSTGAIALKITRTKIGEFTSKDIS